MISSTYLHIADLRVEVEHCSNLDWSSEPDVVHVNAPWATFTLRIRKESKSISCKSVLLFVGKFLTKHMSIDPGQLKSLPHDEAAKDLVEPDCNRF